MRAAGRGRLVVFEGGEGTGKSTQVRLLADRLAAAGLSVVTTREPGGAPGAELLRRLLLETPPEGGWQPFTEALLHYAARNEHVQRTLAPALGAGSWVVCDRFADSTAAYQGAGLEVAPEDLAALRRLVLRDFQPDLVVLLDLDPQEGLRRAAARSGRPDRYEREDVAFHRRVRAAFLALAEAAPALYATIDAAPAVDVVHDAVRAAVAGRLGTSFAL